MEEYIKRVYPKWSNETHIFEPQRSSQPRENTSIPELASLRYSLNGLDNNEQLAQSRTLNILMDALRPENTNRSPAPASSGSFASPNKNTVLQNMMFAAPHPQVSTSPQVSPAKTGTDHRNQTRTPQQVRSSLVMLAADEAKAARESAAAVTAAEQNMLLLQSGTLNGAGGTQQAENNLLEQYEQEIKRRDSNMNNFNASSTLNINQLGLTNKSVNNNNNNNEIFDNRNDNIDDARMNQLNMWTTSPKSLRNENEQPVFSPPSLAESKQQTADSRNG